MKNGYTKNLMLCAMFTALIAVGAFVTVPIPVVPLSLQDLFVMLAGILLGAKWGSLSVLIYVVLGLAGLPIFTHGGGISYVLQPSFGFILGFIPGAYIAGGIANRGKGHPGFWRLLGACLASIGVIYVFGTVYLILLNKYYLGNTIAFWPLILACDIQPLPGDVIKSVIAAKIGERMIPLIREGLI